MHKLPPSFCRQKIVQWAVAGQRQMDLIAFTSKDRAKPFTMYHIIHLCVFKWLLRDQYQLVGAYTPGS